jgi:diguanylate cyclase (GGDEF)-like protein/hemerythrin-like metal-binding protein
VKLGNFRIKTGTCNGLGKLILPPAVAAAFERIRKPGSLAQPRAAWPTRMSRKTGSTGGTRWTAFARSPMRCAAMARIGVSPGCQPAYGQQGDSKQTLRPAPVSGSGKGGGRQLTALRGRPLGFRLLMLVVGLYMLTLAALLVGSAYLTHEHMIRDRVSKLEAVVEIAGTMATLLEADVDASRLTKAQAIERFRKFVYAARYNGADYLFAYGLDGRVIALGNDPEVQGQNRLGLRDVKGTLLIQEMLAAARGGGWAVTYWYPRRPGEPPVPKLAYVKDFLPWNMLIGSGVYVGDIDAAFGAYLGEVAVVLLAALAVAGGLAFWIGRDVAASISERRAAEARIIHLAHHDTLTDLPNRAFFEDTLSHAVWRANRDPSAGVALLLCDLDGFKEVNDTFGHQAGDAVLQATARRFLGCIRDHDTLARLGGDEFSVVLPWVTSGSAAQLVAARLVDAARQPIHINGHEITVGVSVGIALLPAHGSTGDALVAAADAALYEAKRGGRGRFAFATTPGSRPAVSLPLITWTTAHDVGIDVMDRQHRKLAEHVNDLGASLMRGDGPAAISDRLAAAVSYARRHFESEESLMAAHGFADASSHRKSHAQLLDDLQSFSPDFDTRSMILATRFLQEWLLRHIETEDRRLGVRILHTSIRRRKSSGVRTPSACNRSSRPVCTSSTASKARSAWSARTRDMLWSAFPASVIAWARRCMTSAPVAAARARPNAMVPPRIVLFGPMRSQDGSAARCAASPARSARRTGSARHA